MPRARPRARRGALALALAGLLAAGPAAGHEYSLVEDSTVLGRNRGYPDGTPLQGLTEVGAIDLVIEGATFIENLEALGPVPGETFIGFLLPLRFRYRPSEPVVVELGAVIGQNFGDSDSLDEADPLFRIGYEPWRDVFLVAGTIFPTHWIHDAILDDVQKFRQVTEQGFQVRVDREPLQQDAWLNWRERETDFDPEKFEMGNATELRLLGERLWLEYHFLWDHVGGQINQAGTVDHNLSHLGGASWGFPRPFGGEVLEEIRLGGRAFFSTDDPTTGTQKNGSGWEAHAGLELRPWPRVHLRLHGSHFDGSRFLARRGDPRYALAEYDQAGFNARVDVGGGLRLEAGGVYQRTAGDANFSFLVSFVWGQAFAADFLVPRPLREARAGGEAP